MDRRELGQWFTAAPVARLAFAAIGPIDARWRALDPTCGDGAFLAAAREAGLRATTGVEIDRDLAARARAFGDVVEADLLSPGLVERLGTFDLVIGNPPYVRAGRVDPAIKRARAALLAADWPALDPALIAGVARHADVAATCVLRALRLVRPGGRLALVVSTALLDADGAAPLWRAIEAIASVDALIVAPAERWFADAAVNAMVLVATRGAAPRSPRLLRLRAPTALAASQVGLDAIAQLADERTGADWSAALRAPAAWSEFAARADLVPLGALAEVRRGLTTGANHAFYVARAEAQRRKLEPRYLADVVRSPFNGSPAPIAIAPGESPVVALALPRDAELAEVPKIRAWLRGAKLNASSRRRDPWWSLPLNPARLFLAKAYGPRFVQRLADVPMLADQRVYALAPRPGVFLEALAAVLNGLPTALALESLGRASMGYGVVEWTARDALALPVLDVRNLDPAPLAAALAGFGRRPIDHVKLERDRADRAALDALLVPDGALRARMWDALLASVALRDRYLLPSV